MKALIVIPTYNEKENIVCLSEEVLRQDKELEILIIDDNSPDGTGDIADRLAAGNRRIRVMHREGKMGLGTAYILGFKYALSRPDIDCVFEMDADFSHRPEYIPDFLKAIEDADLVLGSRYVPGGGVRNWNFARKVISRGGSMFARVMLGLPARDCTGGYRCYRREALKKIDLETISAEGFGFQVEMLNACHRAGLRVREIPIIFPDRERGTTKISKKIIIEAFIMVCRLRIKTLMAGRR